MMLHGELVFLWSNNVPKFVHTKVRNGGLKVIGDILEFMRESTDKRDSEPTILFIGRLAIGLDVCVFRNQIF